jgi:hypothetical protein
VRQVSPQLMRLHHGVVRAVMLRVAPSVPCFRARSQKTSDNHQPVLSFSSSASHAISSYLYSITGSVIYPYHCAVRKLNWLAGDLAATARAQTTLSSQRHTLLLFSVFGKELNEGSRMNLTAIFRASLFSPLLPSRPHALGGSSSLWLHLVSAKPVSSR